MSSVCVITRAVLKEHTEPVLTSFYLEKDKLTACQHSSCHSGNNAQGKNLVHALVFHNVSSLKSGSLYAESPFLYHSRFFRQDIKLKHTDNIGNISP